MQLILPLTRFPGLKSKTLTLKINNLFDLLFNFIIPETNYLSVTKKTKQKNKNYKNIIKHKYKYSFFISLPSQIVNSSADRYYDSDSLNCNDCLVLLFLVRQVVSVKVCSVGRSRRSQSFVNVMVRVSPGYPVG